MEEIRILSPCGILGYGFPLESFMRGVERRPDVIAVDAGSTDAGPHKLGAGVGIVSETAMKKDLEPILTWAHRLKIPAIIGSAGGAGAKEHVEWTRRIVEEVVDREKLAFETAVIHADVTREYVLEKWKTNRLEPLGPAPELTRESIESTRRIVGQMGCEPIMEALKHGAGLIIAGRAYDPAPFAALPILKGFPPALALHLGKILECGALCADPGTAKDCIIGYLRKDHFVVESLNSGRICSTVSVAAHTFYEKGHPYILQGPGFELDLSRCEFEQHTESTVKVSGSRISVPEKYTIKLEGAARAAYRTIVIAGVRDPIIIDNIEEIKKGVIEQVRNYFPELNQEDYRIIFHVYGKNGVMGELEPESKPGHEIGIVMEAVASTQEMANTICASARSTMLHYPYRGRKTTAGNLAFPYSPSDIEFGPVYEFTVYHLVEVDDPCDLFPIEYGTIRSSGEDRHE